MTELSSVQGGVMLNDIKSRLTIAPINTATGRCVTRLAVFLMMMLS